MTFSLERNHVFSCLKGAESVFSDKEKDKPTGAKHEVISETSIEAVIPFVHVDLEKVFFLLVNKPFIGLSYLSPYEVRPEIPGKFFKILFTDIISPNAP